MALSEQARHRYFEYLSETGLEAEVTSEVLSYFPARDVEQPVTKAGLHEELALVRLELRSEMSDLREELRGEMSDLREELRGEMSDLREELRGEMSDLREELRGEMSDLRGELRGEMSRQLRWLIGTQLSVIAIIVALAALVVAFGG